VGLKWRDTATALFLHWVAVVKLEVLFSGGRVNHRDGPGGMKKSKSLSLRQIAPIDRDARRTRYNASICASRETNLNPHPTPQTRTSPPVHE